MIDTNEMREKINMYECTDEELLALCDEIDRLRAPKPKPQGKTVREFGNGK